MAKTLSQVTVATDTFLAWVQKTNDAVNAISTECLTANSDANGALTVGNTRLNGIMSANTFAVITELRGGNVQSSGLLSITSNTNVTGGQMNVSSNLVLSAANLYVSGLLTTVANVTFKSNTTYNMMILTANSTAKAITANVDTFTIVGNLVIGNATLTNVSITSASVNVLSGNTVNTVSVMGNTVTVGQGSLVNFHTGVTTVNTQTTSVQLIDSYTIGYNTAKLLIEAKDQNANAWLATEMLILQDGALGTTYTTEYAILLSNGSLGTFSANCNTTHVRVYMTPTVANSTVKIVKMLIS